MMSLYGQNFVSRLLLAKAHLETMAGNLQVAITYSIAYCTSNLHCIWKSSKMSHAGHQLWCFVIQIEKVMKTSLDETGV